MGYIMCKAQCVLAVVALYVGLAHSLSWDYALITTKQIDYYSDRIITRSENISPPLKYINNIIYDGVSERMFLVNYSQKILSYDLKAKKFETVVLNNDYTNHNLQSLSYDPVEQKLFWLDSMGRAIKWVSLTPGAKNDDGGNVFATLDIRKPIAIAVDSCNGYIYWSGTEYDGENNKFKSSIWRMRLDGGSSEVVVADIRNPLENSLVVDQNSKKLYWIVKEKYDNFYIESADLDGSNKIIVFNGTSSEPNFLALSEDSLYWTYNTYYRGVAQKFINDESHRLISMYAEKDSRIVTNYKLNDNIPGCERQKRLSTNFNNAVSNVNSVCYNYCFNGNCTTSAGGQPQCRCKPGFSGDRCEVDLCRGYCLNRGRCSIDKNNKPVCQCNPSFGSDQCEIPVFLIKSFAAIRTLKDIISIDLPPLPPKCGDF